VNRVLLHHDDTVAAPRELMRRRQSGRTSADYDDRVIAGFHPFQRF
jgi:hypothetical protein